MGGTILGLLVLGSVSEQAKQASKQCSSMTFAVALASRFPLGLPLIMNCERRAQHQEGRGCFLLRSVWSTELQDGQGYKERPWRWG